MKNLITLTVWQVFLMVFVNQGVKAFEVPPVSQRFKYNTNTSTPVNFGDNKTVSLTPTTGSFTDEAPRDLITLGVDQAFGQYFGSSMTVKVKLLVKPLDPSSSQYPIYLQIYYTPFDTSTYRDQQSYSFSSLYKYRVTIDSIYVNGTFQNTLPNNLYVDLSVGVTRWYTFSGTAPTGLSYQVKDLNCNSDTDEVQISWTGTTDAEEYQLEWTFINDYDGVGGYLTTGLRYDFRNNATRVTTYGTSYSIPLIFDHGYIVSRVRSIGRSSTPPHYVLYGSWNIASAGSPLSVTSYKVVRAHEKKKNWQLATTFAEEGKKKEVISYFDGSLRNRETVTKLNTDTNIIVGQTIYDHEGRPSVTVLPVPVGDVCTSQTGTQGAIKYYPQFNKNSTGSEYNRINFDRDTTGSCIVQAGPMSSTSGSSRYYSPSNPNQTGFQAFVPDAQLFPFSQVEYTPDNTGRIRRQSGVGPTFQLGSGHETFYYYGKPQQLEVDRLFGSEAGDASHYQKNMVRDPNGQTSVSYLDQEGRTIATSLAGDTVPGLVGLPSEDNAKVFLTSDLFNKDANGNSILNTVNVNGNGIDFNSQLLVGYASTYSFNYNFIIDTLYDPCLKSNICFNCIYDLQIQIIDECGINHAPNIKKTVGHFSLDGNGNLILLFQCTPTHLLTELDSFHLVLSPGNYTVSKTLTINQEAKDAFIAAYLDTTYNKCVLTLQDFVDNALAALDTSSCYITCEECVQSLGSRDSFVALGYGSALLYDYLADQCRKPCQSYSPCQTSYQMMLGDVSPNGQYGEYKDPNEVINVSLFPLSVFNEDNQLPKADTANWRHPNITLNSSNYQSYVEDDGELSVIILSGSPGSFTPELEDISAYYYSSNGYYYTYPENLKHIEDFIYYWKPSWARSLVLYHPEYCYYLSCMEYSQKPANSPLSSDDFDALLNSAYKYTDAISLKLITTSTTGTPISRITQWWSSGGTTHAWDPFMVDSPLYDNYGGELDYRMHNYMVVNGTMMDIVGYAAYQARCEGLVSKLIINNPVCDNFNGSYLGITDSIRNKEWKILKGLYLSLKAQLQFERANAHAITCAGYNGCIGESNWSSYGTPMLNASCTNCPFYDSSQPCSSGTYALYWNKQRRFVDPSNSGLFSTDLTQGAYQAYLLTGQCPNAANFELFLSELASKDKLKSTTAVTVNTYSSFNGLYNSLYDFNPPDPITSHNFKWTGGTANNMSFTIKDGATTVYTGHLNKTGAGITSWTDVKVFKELHVVSYSSGISTFTVLAGTVATSGSNPYDYHQISGDITPLDLYNCTFEQVCEGNEFAVDLSLLMSKLASQNKLTSTTNVPLHNSIYSPYVTASILNWMGAPPTSHLRWIYKPSVQRFEIKDSLLTSDSIVITLTGAEPSTFNYTSLSSIEYFNNIVSDYYNFFKVDAYNSADNLIVKLQGEVVKYHGSTVTTVSMGDCHLPTSILCTDPVYKTTKDFFDIISDILLNKDLSSSQNIFDSPYMTTELAQLFLPDTFSSSIEHYQTAGGVFKDSLIFTFRHCDFSITYSHATPPHYLSDITSIDEIGLLGPVDDYGNFHNFFIIAHFGASFQDTVFGSICIPLRLCECHEELPPPPGARYAHGRTRRHREGAGDEMLLGNDDFTEGDSTQVNSEEVQVDSSYNSYATTLDSLYEQLSVSQSDSVYVPPIDEIEFEAGGFIYSMNTYQVYLDHFNPDIDTLEHIADPTKFVLWYGNYMEVDKEYHRYLAAIKKYNGRCTQLGIDTMVALDDSSFYNGLYADSIFSFIDYLSTYPQDSSETMDAEAFRSSHGYTSPDSSCYAWYRAYLHAYLIFRNRQLAINTCPEWNTVAPLYTYQAFIDNNLCCSDSGAAAIYDYIQSLLDTTNCPGPLPYLDMCSEGAMRMAMSVPSCQDGYTNYVNLINEYNNSYYATSTSHFLDIIYLTYSEFEGAGLCGCYLTYITYLTPYLTATDVQLPQPENISEFCLSAPVSPCESDYQIYYTAVQAYDSFALDHRELGLHIIDPVISSSTFIANDYCHCAEAFATFLQSIIYGITPIDGTIDSQIDNFFVTCLPSLIPPCTQQLALDTLYNVQFPPGPDPCVVQLMNTAVYNAGLAYDHYKDSLTAYISNKYVSHCLGVRENFDASYQFKEYHFTLYYYDQAGNLVKTVPPEGVEQIGVTSSNDGLEQQIIADRTNHKHTVFTSHRLYTLYEYNSLNQLVRQSLPDHDKMDIYDPIVPSGLNPDLQVTAIQFVSESRGYLAGFIDLGSGVKRGCFYTTTDGGFTWQFSTTVPGTDLKKIFWASSSIGYAVGSEGTLIKTTDGGQNWDLLNTYISNNDIYSFNDLYFTNTTTGCIVGKNGKILKTVNGGATFTVLVNQNSTDEFTSITYDSGSSLYYATLVEQYSGTIPVKGSRILQIDNSGSFRYDTIYPLNPYKIRMYGKGKAYGVGINGSLVKRVKVGTSYYWLTIESQIKRDFRDVDFITDLIGVALIDSAVGYSQLFKTIDGGVNWRLLTDTGEYYNAMYVFNTSSAIHKLVAVGKKGRVLKISYFPDSSFGVIHLYPVNGINSTTELFSIWGSESGNVLHLIAGGNSNLYLNANSNSLGSTWSTSAVGGFGQVQTIEAKDFSPTGTDISGIILSFGGIGKGFNYHPTLVVGSLTGSFSNYLDARWDRSNNRIILSGTSTTKLVYATLAASTVPSTTSDLNISSQSISSAVYHFDVKSDTLIGSTFANNIGNLIWGKINTGTSSITLSREDFSYRSVPLRDIQYAQTNIFSSGNTGALCARKASVLDKFWTIKSSAVSGINAIKFTNATTGFAVNDSGLISTLSYSGYNGGYSQYYLGNKDTLNDLAISSGALYAVGNNGAMIYSSNSSLPFSKLFCTNHVNLYGVAFKTSSNNAYIVGDESQLFLGVTGTQVQLPNVYLHSILSFHFVDSQNGYLLSDSFNIRQTHNGGLTWNIVTPDPSGPVGGSYPRLLTLRCSNSLLSFAGGNSRQFVQINDRQGVLSTFSMPTGVPNNSSTNILGFGMSVSSGDLKYMIAQNTSNLKGYFLVKSGPWTTDTTYTSSAYPKGLWVFRNDNVLIAGAKSLLYFFDGTHTHNVYPATFPSNMTLNSVAFYDDINGYVGGVGGFLMKTSGWRFNTYPFAILYNQGTWEQKQINDGLANQTTPSNITINAIGTPGRFWLMTGGSYSPATLPAHIGYSRLTHDESVVYSTRFWYDKVGRLILSQNTKQFNVSPKQYSYSLYDALGRIIQAGVKTENTGTDPKFASIFGSYVSSYYNPNVIDDANLNNWIVTTSGSRKEVTKTFYDNSVSGITFPTNFTQENLRKRISTVSYEESYTANATSYDNAAHYSYDIHGNVKSLLQDNKLLTTASPAVPSQRFKQINYTYDLISGKVNTVGYEADSADEWNHRYTYDADNRIRTAETSKNNVIWDMDAKYFYYQHGPLARTEIGNNNVQGIDYVYTLQGWIKGINCTLLDSLRDVGQDGFATSVNKQFAPDAFSYSLGYFTGDYRPIDTVHKWHTVLSRFVADPSGSQMLNNRADLFNGNISYMMTSIKNPTTGEKLPQATAYKYDQLNRLLEERAFKNINFATNKWKTGSTYNNRYFNKFSYDADGNIVSQQRYDSGGVQIENLTYKYFNDNGKLLQNRLYAIIETVNDNLFPDDIDHQVSFVNDKNYINKQNNYSYTELGELKKDSSEEIANILWRTDGKIKEINRKSGSSKSNLKFEYDPLGNRLAKHIYTSGNMWLSSTYYIRDAKGNLLATYSKTINQVNQTLSYKLKERYIYGTSRSGLYGENVEMIGSVVNHTYLNHLLAKKQFEGVNHLENILVIFTDRKFPKNNGGIVSGYKTEVLISQDYFPFGTLMTGRTFSPSIYRFGYNEMENDNEVKGSGNSLDFGTRIYDSRLGSFISLDPLFKNNPWQGPYSFAGNNPVRFIDIHGKGQGDPPNYKKNSASLYLPINEYSSQNVIGYPLNFAGNTIGFLWNGVVDAYNKGLEYLTAAYHCDYNYIYDDANTNATNFVNGFSRFPTAEEWKATLTNPHTYEQMAGIALTMKATMMKEPIVPKAKNAVGLLNSDGTVLVKSVRFTQETVNNYDLAVNSLKNGTCDPIDIVKMQDGMYSSIDNTRLLAAQNEGMGIKGIVHNYSELLPDEMAKRFGLKSKTGEYAKTWGEAVEYRIQNQSKAFREAYTGTGTFVKPKINSR